jgi:hypothetical protein
MARAGLFAARSREHSLQEGEAKARRKDISSLQFMRFKLKSKY